MHVGDRMKKLPITKLRTFFEINEKKQLNEKEMEYWRLRYCTLCALATTEIQINIQNFKLCFRAS
jgi:hypothetical protein